MIGQPSPVLAGSPLRRALSVFLDLLFPPHCIACGKPGDWLCAACVASAPLLRVEQCPRCGGILAAESRCPACQRTLPHLAGARSVAAHLPPFQQAVHALKYEGLRVLAEPLGEIMACAWRAASVRVDAIVPVPLHADRRRERGYNQSELLARAFGRRVDLPVRADWLLRERSTRAQVGLSLHERWENVSGAFRASHSDPSGARALLIDDVLTTGATLEACASALVEAGAREVWAFTLTHGVGSDRRAP